MRDLLSYSTVHHNPYSIFIKKKREEKNGISTNLVIFFQNKSVMFVISSNFVSNKSWSAYTLCLDICLLRHILLDRISI